MTTLDELVDAAGRNGTPADQVVWGIRDELTDAGRWDWPNVKSFVLAHPVADWPRHLAAAWFDAAGDSRRAGFIRVGLEIAAASKSTADDYGHVQGLEDTQSGFLSDRERPWFSLPSFPAGFGENGPLCWFSGNTGVGRNPHSARIMEGMIDRGFVGEVRCDWGVWLSVHKELLAEQPVRKVTLGEMGMSVESRRLGVPAFNFEVRIQGLKKWYPPMTTARAMVEAEWPGIEFAGVFGSRPGLAGEETPPPDRYVFRRGDLVSAGGDGRLVPCPGNEESLVFGRVVSGPDSAFAYRITPLGLFASSGAGGTVRVEAAEVPPGVRFEEYPVEAGVELEPGDPVTLMARTGRIPYFATRPRSGNRLVGFVQSVLLADVPFRYENRYVVRVRMLPVSEPFRG